MKITYITHACQLIEVAGKRILTDPWLVGACWGGNLWHYPPPKRTPESISNIDYIYFSHIHDDHFHPESIARLSKEVKKSQVIISDFDKPYFERAVRAKGFDNILVLKHDESINLVPGLKLDMIRNDIGDDDSSIVLQADDSTVFCQTDNLMSLNEAKRLGNKYNVDLLFTMPTKTGIFPGFFEFPPDVMIDLAEKKSKSARNYSLDVAQALKAKVIVPYASDICYLGDLYFANDLHFSDKQEYYNLATKRLPNAQVIPMGPNDEITINNGKIQTKISEPEYTRKNLAAYYVTMRQKVETVKRQERCYVNTSYNQDIVGLRKGLDELTKQWKSDPFTVLWCIIDDNGNETTFWHCLPQTTADTNTNKSYDLKIELPSYRLQRLVRGDYFMGAITLWNGSIRCHRHTLELTKPESDFWRWIIRLKF
jgi:hypothetical protein